MNSKNKPLYINKQKEQSSKPDFSRKIISYIKAQDISRDFKISRDHNRYKTYTAMNYNNNMINSMNNVNSEVINGSSRSRGFSRNSKNSRNSRKNSDSSKKNQKNSMNLKVPDQQNNIIQQFRSVKDKISQSIIRYSEYQKNQKKVRNIQNIKNPRDRQIILQYDQSLTMQYWVGKMVQRVSSQAFDYFIKKQITYDQTKILCCSNFLRNIIDFISKKDNINMKTVDQIDKIIAKTIDYLCYKYPQTIQRQANKRLQEAIKYNQINNLEDDSYDLLAISGFTFQYMPCKDYSDQIMKFLNFLISMPFTPPKSQTGDSRSSSYDSNNKSQDQMAPFKKFQLLMSKIFEVVYKKDSNTDFTQVINMNISPNTINVNKKLKKTQEEIEYMEKVKSYTKFSIGTKFSESTPLFSEIQIQSGNIDVKSPQILRVLIKWLDELTKAIDSPQKFFLQRIYRFKGKNPSQRKKLTPQFLKILYDKILIKIKQAEIVKKNVRGRISETCINLCKQQNMDQLKQLSFLDQSQRIVGDFTVKMSKLAQQCIIKSIEEAINGLFKIVNELKQQWLERNEYFSQSPIFKNLDIDLVTFKISDIMRCKCISHQDQIVRIFEVIRMISQIQDSDLIKIVRIKNRLNQGTRDILINILFDKKCLCQIQLSVASQISENQMYFDKFNHFLYQIKRSQIGCIMQMCNVLMHVDPRATTFIKALEAQSARKRQNRFQCLTQCPLLKPANLRIYELPFICSACKIFHPYQKTIFPNKINPQNGHIICGQCLSKRISENLLSFYVFEKLSHKIRTFVATETMIDQGCVIRLKTLQDLQKHDEIFLIPINSRIVNFLFTYRIKLDEKHLFITSKLKPDGSQAIYQKKFVIANQQDLKTFFDTFLVYGCPFPHQYDIIDPQTIFANDYVTSKMINSIKQSGSKIKIGHGSYQLNNEVKALVLLPIFCDQNVDIKTYFQKLENTSKISKTLKAKRQVLEMSNESISNQFFSLKKDLKVKLYSTIKQLYLNHNNISNIDFVSHMSALQIFQANCNQIEKIPDMPQKVEEVQLGFNKIQKITGFSSINIHLARLSFFENKIQKIEGLNQIPSLKELYLIRNNIKKIQNLDNLPNLTKLGLATNQITKIQNLSNLASLQCIYLSNNKLENLQQIKKLTWIKIIFFNLNQFKKIQPLSQLKNIQVLHLSGNQLTKIENLYYFKHLIHLTLNNNKIKKIQGLQQLKFLQQLHLTSNQISKIQNLNSNRCLKTLFLSNNQISIIQNLQCLNNINFINLSSNKIKKIQNLQTQFHLTKLFLSNNQIKVIQNLQHINSLSELRLDNNQIQDVKSKSLPKKISKINLIKNNLKKMIWMNQYPYAQILIDKDHISTQEKNKYNANQLFLKLHDQAMPKIQLKLLNNKFQNDKFVDQENFANKKRIRSNSTHSPLKKDLNLNVNLNVNVNTGNNK